MKTKQNKNYMKLTSTDYKNILKFYKIDTSTLTPKEIKEKAEHSLAVKLCKCIKNIKTTKKVVINKKYNSERRAIALCYNSVLKKKNLKIFKFNCKKTARLSPKKGTRKIFVEKLNV